MISKLSSRSKVLGSQLLHNKYLMGYVYSKKTNEQTNKNKEHIAYLKFKFNKFNPRFLYFA